MHSLYAGTDQGAYGSGPRNGLGPLRNKGARIQSHIVTHLSCCNQFVCPAPQQWICKQATVSSHCQPVIVQWGLYPCLHLLSQAGPIIGIISEYYSQYIDIIYIYIGSDYLLYLYIQEEENSLIVDLEN